MPSLVLYTTMSTLKSTIGHRNERYEDYWSIAVRLDDFLHLTPTRLTDLPFALACSRTAPELRSTQTDVRTRHSPNVGWPEASPADVLSVRIFGSSGYMDSVAEEQSPQEGAPDPTTGDMAYGLSLDIRVMAVVGTCCFAIGIWS